MNIALSCAPHSAPNVLQHHSQRGAILFVGLIFLIILSMLGLTALRSATMQERMSGNMRDRGIAFQAAESALRAAENYLTNTASPPAATTFTLTTLGTGTCTTKGVYKLIGNIPYFVAKGNATGGITWDGANPDFWNGYPWETANCYFTNNLTYVADADLGKPGKPIKQPRYVIEELPANGTGLASYRVTAKGWGSSDNAVVILQATYTSN